MVLAIKRPTEIGKAKIHVSPDAFIFRPALSQQAATPPNKRRAFAAIAHSSRASQARRGMATAAVPVCAPEQRLAPTPARS